MNQKYKFQTRQSKNKKVHNRNSKTTSKENENRHRRQMDRQTGWERGVVDQGTLQPSCLKLKVIYQLIYNLTITIHDVSLEWYITESNQCYKEDKYVNVSS